MKTLILIFVIIGFSFAVNAQNVDIQNMKVETKKAYYQGGDSLFYVNLSKSIQYSDEAKARQIRAEVMVSFDVMPDGTLSNISVINNPGYGIGDAIKTALSKMIFVPSTTGNGTAIRSSVMISIPIHTF